MNQGMVGIALTLSSLPPTAQNTSTVIERVERPCRLTQAPESIYCNNFVMAITGCRVTLVVTWPPRSQTTLPRHISSVLAVVSSCLAYYFCYRSTSCAVVWLVVAWSLVVSWRSLVVSITPAAFPLATVLAQAPTAAR